jgi:hypothetical protein
MTLETKTRAVLDTCSYYESIVNYKFKESDILTKHLISSYTTQIFDVDSKDLGKTNQLKVIDIVMHEYISDSKFFRYVKENISFEDVELDESSLVEHDLIMILIKLYNNYRKKKEDEIEQTAWI